MSRKLPFEDDRDASVRDRLREILRRHGLAEEFDAVMTWEDEMLAFANEAAATCDRLQEALITCAEIAGEGADALSAARCGALVRPTIEELAIDAVTRLRADYDDA